jgi:hypothetical protein
MQWRMLGFGARVYGALSHALVAQLAFCPKNLKKV